MKKLTKSSSSVLYKKDQKQKVLKNTKLVVEEQVVRRSVPLPEGIREALLTKVQLLKYLKDRTDMPLSVSIDVYNSQWVLMVHGFDPGFRYFKEYKVFYARSKLASKI
jgi:hypothetical protein